MQKSRTNKNFMNLYLGITFLFFSLSSYSQGTPAAYIPNHSELQKADGIARETAAWFEYTTGPMESEHLGQCGDVRVARRGE